MPLMLILSDWWASHRLPFDTYIAAIVLYAINKQQNKKPFSLLATINVAVGMRARPLVVLMDVLLTSAVGSYLTFKLTIPTTEAQAIVAGLGMTGILSAITKNRL